MKPTKQAWDRAKKRLEPNWKYLKPCYHTYDWADGGYVVANKHRR